ncbi:HAAS signaling domain-containing protein [Knoellia sp. LjRoot47]|uniref:HAAS signaling domain-containing protein n=1 Tax=Knoellia sp. LjRoot47 TaxID=3342330 RepID=UPI003ECC5571
MTPATTHPLVTAWLRDLELMLHGVDPGERAEVLAGVHEHLDASLPPDASEDDVRRALAGLGSPQSVADEAYAVRPTTVVVPSPRPRPSPWLAHVACFLNGAGLALLTLLTLLRWLGSGSMAPHASELVFTGMLFLLPWLCLVVLTSMAEVWASADKFRSLLLYPVTLAALSAAGLADISVLSPAVSGLALGIAVRVLVRLVRAAGRRGGPR